jgi:hypothetical protein
MYPHVVRPRRRLGQPLREGRLGGQSQVVREQRHPSSGDLRGQRGEGTAVSAGSPPPAPGNVTSGAPICRGRHVAAWVQPLSRPVQRC